ncbi:MAG: sugar ABC transporter permease [Fimbriimonadaceae bacterium]|jgi:multiple sugar transport system permease protein|nr:sugar ABC transporter permease [Fimbriimonadaceae bacterium]
MSRQKRQQNLIGYLFISPWLIGFSVFTAWPFLQSLWLSFTRYDIISEPKWVGFANYHALFTQDPQFWQSLQVTFTYAAVAVPLGILCGFGLALLLNIRIKGQEIYRTLFYIPSIVPAVATSVIFVWIMNPQIGLLNGLLKTVGIIGPNWLNDPTWSLTSLVLISLWGVGGSMVIYLAGLKDVPLSLYEASLVDGASAWHRLKAITWPFMTPVIFFNLIMGVIGSFQYFTNAFIMTNGGPQDSTLFYSLYLFNRAFRYLDMGYASAMAWILFVIVVGATSILFMTQKKWVQYGNN